MGKESSFLFHVFVEGFNLSSPLIHGCILDHMGKESSFLPPEMQIYPSPHGEGVMLPSSKLVHPSPASPQNTTLPFPTMYTRKDSSPFKMQNPYKSFPTKSFLYLYFSCYFYLFIFFFDLYIFLKIFSWNLISPPPPKLWILPQSGKIIPQHLGRIIEE